MKTHNPSKKAMYIVFVALLAHVNNTFAQSHILIEADRDKQNDNSTLILSFILFVVGFAILITLKLREDKKPHREISAHYPTRAIRNKYGHRSQYDH